MYNNLKIRFILIFLPLCLLSMSTSGQNRKAVHVVKGTVIEKTTQIPLGGASIWCYEEKKVTRLINVVYTKADGCFKISVPDEGRYKIVVRSYGFISDSLTVQVGDSLLNIGDIELSQGMDISDIQSLKQITVNARQPLIEKHSDRIVYDVTRDPDARRMRMTGILEKIPSMNFSSGKLEYTGMSIGLIFINGEEHEFINENTQFPMNHIRGDVMAQIEVIPPGSPQYDNNVTIVNIITSRPLPNGFATEIEGSGKTDNSWGTDLNFVSKICNEFIFRIGYSGLWQERPKLNTETLYERIEGDSTVFERNSRTKAWSIREKHNFKFRSSIKLGENKLDLGLNTSFGESHSYNMAEHIIFNGTQKSHLSTFYGRSKTVPSLNGDIRFNFKRTKRKWVYIAYNYADNRIESFNSTELTPEDEDIYSERRSNGVKFSKIHTVQTFNKFTFDAGHSLTARGLYVNRRYNDLTRYSYLYPGETGEDEIRGLNYKQQIISLKGHYNYRSRLFSTAATLGAEYETNRGIFRDSDTHLRHDNLHLTPRISLTWLLGKYSLGSSYNMRSIRPTMGMLNPYKDNSDPKNILQGNPNLHSETAHNISLSLYRNFGTLSGKVGLSLSYNLIPDAIERVTEPADNNINITTYRNVGRREKYRIGIDNGVIPITRNIYLTYFAGYSIIFYDSHNPNIGSNRTEGFDCIANLSGRLWKSGSLKIDYYLSSTQTLSQSIRTSYLHQFAIRIDQSIIKNKLSASLTATNPFSSHASLQKNIAGSNFRMTTRNEYLGRIFGFSLRANFGHLKDRVPQAKTVPDDTSRD